MTTKRRPGRPRKEAADAPSLVRQDIVDRAWELTRSEPLTDISIVRLGREFGVSTTAVRYHVGGRDVLISLMVNRFFREALHRMPPSSGHWENDLRSVLPAFLGLLLERRGVATYLETSNRFRIFQSPALGESDYGIQFFDRIIAIFRSADLSEGGCAMAWHYFALTTLASANAQIRRMLPAEHGLYFASVRPKLAERRLTNAQFVIEGMARIDLHTSLNFFSELLIAAIKDGRLEKLCGSSSF